MYPLDEAAGRGDAGGKAERLAAARAVGVRVPDGFVVPHGDEVDAVELGRALDRLGAKCFAVRSSADVEDRAGASAAGVFLSVVPVERAEVAAAIERVRGSALAMPARSYLGARRLGRVRMAVLVQPYVPARRLGVVHTAPILDGAMGAEERSPMEPEWGEVTPRAVPEDDALAHAALQLGRLVGGDADVEYALTDDGIVFLQVRPLSAAALGHDPQLWTDALGTDDARLTWVRDAEHNPEPLSTAQAGLVSLLDEQPGVPRQRVLHGYLYFEAGAAPAALPFPVDQLASTWATRIEPDGDRLLAALERIALDRRCSGATEPAMLEAALQAFVAIAVTSMAELSPSLRAARKALDAFLRQELGEALAMHGALLSGTGGRTLERDAALWALGRQLAHGDAEASAISAVRYGERFGAYAPVWDVAVAPDDEQPERVVRMAGLVTRGPSPEVRHVEALAAAATELRMVDERMGAAARVTLARLVEEARTAQSVAEHDDALFFRAQRLVRRALVSLGRSLVEAGQLDDATLVFDATLDEARRGTIDVASAQARRARRLSERGLSPPSRIVDGVSRWRALAARGATQDVGARFGNGVIVGSGTSGRAWGRAFRLVDPAHPPSALPSGAVLIVDAILPSLTYLIPSAEALVTDHGGALSHAATLAREYGVPAVLGTGGAMAALVDGEALLVDGDAGKVYRMGGETSGRDS